MVHLVALYRCSLATCSYVANATSIFNLKSIVTKRPQNKERLYRSKHCVKLKHKITRAFGSTTTGLFFYFLDLKWSPMEILCFSRVNKNQQKLSGKSRVLNREGLDKLAKQLEESEHFLDDGDASRVVILLPTQTTSRLKLLFERDKISTLELIDPEMLQYMLQYYTVY
ncbi:hypothetical protein WN51_14261 [Melipona quadrifasciata]|uniref:Uncharacterized protein n=1 Tax=Melipona quadrifasciata TaxID=166423 RepID=A0A0M9A1K0_9HYME|nr:hypothetical protein WN51_14261 [Melipona quadrifasciata]